MPQEDPVALFWVATNLALLMAIVAVITGRRSPDPSADRPRAIYLAVAMLPLLAVGVLAAASALDSVVRLALGPESIQDVGSGFGSITSTSDLVALPDTDAEAPATRELVSSLIIAAITLALYSLHLGWRREMAKGEGFAGSPAARVSQAFGYTATLVFVVLLALGTYRAGYGLFRVVLPGVTETGIGRGPEREQGIAEVISGAALAAAAWILLQNFWRFAASMRPPETVESAPVQG